MILHIKDWDPIRPGQYCISESSQRLGTIAFRLLKTHPLTFVCQDGGQARDGASLGKLIKKWSSLTYAEFRLEDLYMIRTRYKPIETRPGPEVLVSLKSECSRQGPNGVPWIWIYRRTWVLQRSATL